MSGGHFNYQNDRLCEEIYGYDIYPNYGERGASLSAKARRKNPLKDYVISELIFDVFCLLHSFDWYESGDTCEETYREDVKRFKDKWLATQPSARVKEIVDDEIIRLREELYKSFNIAGGEPNG